MAAVKRPIDFLPMMEQGWGLPWETTLVVPGTLNARTAVRLATAAALPAGTYDNTPNAGTGQGATFTVTATGILTIDGVAVVLSDRILVKNQAAGLQNGVYSCTTAGTTGVSAVLTRATDMDTTLEYVGAIYSVTAGTANASTYWICSNQSAPTPGTTAIGFGSFVGHTTYYVPFNGTAGKRSRTSPGGYALEVTDALFDLRGTGYQGAGQTITGTTILITKNGLTRTACVGTIAGGVTEGHDEESLRGIDGRGLMLAPGDYLTVIVTAIPDGTTPTAPTGLTVKLRGYTQGAQ